MRSRVNDLYKDLCVPKPKSFFYVVDQENGVLIDNVSRETSDENGIVSRGTMPEDYDICVYFVT